MARAMNPNSLNNLKVPTHAEAKKNGSKGGKASGIARRNYSSMRDALKEFLTDDKMDELISALFMTALEGNVQAFKLIFETFDQAKQDDSNATKGIIHLSRDIMLNDDLLTAYIEAHNFTGGILPDKLPDNIPPSDDMIEQ